MTAEALAKARNPYRPGVGLRPRILAGREAELARFDAGLRGAPKIPANVRLTGLRGVGKTVLLRELDETARKAGWATAQNELEPRHNTADQLLALIRGMIDEARKRVSAVERVKDAASNAAGVIGRIGVKYDDLTFSFDAGGHHEMDLARALVGVAELAERHGRRGFVLLFDEAQVLRDDPDQDDYPLSLLLAAVSAVQKEQVPVVLVVSGLPTLTGHLLKARTYSERMFRGEEIGSLRYDDARSAFVGPLNGTEIGATEDLVLDVLREVAGYPYFIQLWGAELWDARSKRAPRISRASCWRPCVHSSTTGSTKTSTGRALRPSLPLSKTC